MADEYAAPVDPREGPFQYDAFRGLRNNVGSSAFAPGDMTEALNIDIDDALGVSRRYGFSSALTTGIDRDFWADDSIALGVGSDTLKLINPDFSTATLRTGLAHGHPLSYARIGNRTFWSNGADTGVVQDSQNRTWGIALPSRPALAPGAGTLLAGEYQCAVTYLRADGQESGAGLASTITLATIGGITLSGISVSTDPTVTFKAIYATSVGGETMFQVGIIPNAQTTFLIDTVRPGASPLLTQFLQPPPPGDFIAESRGCMLAASGNRLYPSEPYAPELFDYRKSVPFDGAITMIAPINDSGAGVYIGTLTKLIWLQGEAPEAWEYRTVAQYGVIPGTLCYGDGALLGGNDSNVKVAFFATQRGLCAGRAGGAFTNLSEARFSYPIQPRGAGVVRRHRGMAQFICTMAGAEVAGNVAA